MAAVGAVVRYGRKILVGKKRSDSVKKLAGKWHLPGEKIEKYETDEDALKRCLLEECGLEIEVGRYIGRGITPTSRSEIKWYECFASTNKIKIGSDLEDAGWFTTAEAHGLLKERHESWPQELRDYFNLFLS